MKSYIKERKLFRLFIPPNELLSVQPKSTQPKLEEETEWPVLVEQLLDASDEMPYARWEKLYYDIAIDSKLKRKFQKALNQLIVLIVEGRVKRSNGMYAYVDDLTFKNILPDRTNGIMRLALVDVELGTFDWQQSMRYLWCFTSPSPDLRKEMEQTLRESIEKIEQRAVTDAELKYIMGGGKWNACEIPVWQKWKRTHA